MLHIIHMTRKHRRANVLNKYKQRLKNTVNERLSGSRKNKNSFRQTDRSAVSLAVRRRNLDKQTTTACISISLHIVPSSPAGMLLVALFARFSDTEIVNLVVRKWRTPDVALQNVGSGLLVARWLCVQHWSGLRMPGRISVTPIRANQLLGGNDHSCGWLVWEFAPSATLFTGRPFFSSFMNVVHMYVNWLVVTWPTHSSLTESTCV